MQFFLASCQVLPRSFPMFIFSTIDVRRLVIVLPCASESTVRTTTATSYGDSSIAISTRSRREFAVCLEHCLGRTSINVNGHYLNGFLIARRTTLACQSLLSALAALAALAGKG